KDDCWAYLEAFEVIGSFTNYAFWMTDKHGVVAERKTLHGIYLQDASQNAGDARAAVLASAGAGEACSELAQPAEALAKSYQSQFDKLTAALKVCAMDKSATKWKDCPGAAGEALKFDDEARASGGPLERYLQLVDGGKQQCISEDGRALLEQMRRSPCERPSNWATEGSRCAHSRYGLATGRIGQLSKVRGNLSKVSSGSVLGAAAQTAFEMVGDAQSELSKLVGNPAEDNRILFDNTYRVFAAQKVLEAGKHFCSRYE
ncbi:MAG: hypothetical protein HY553_20500, partial [Elusimicrobia bacterium]|nr:hypothetical protein [Elusimicrobiota bacterium]